ncbi:transporter [Rhodoblastus acidophilus]|uniref:Transporter n=1 Tax=Candidatus Rhodoblastus alkanivorans TaxID=2954117 RepID=A0ABS9Z4G1_9HYPH|nr:transporter [Candidatus Rhodoblastus alkanivorans]MCI4679973.1 transporter [Candidatus Rhodoblastus alkanivorans]MCI4682356.1 transporter [Candidatus Rhodoblastus alkanivorans]MDI4639659.1 transporter [Rhodoblastus acidophilus]
MSLKKSLAAMACGCLSLCAATTASFANSGIQPGITTGIPLGAAPPEGVYIVQLPNYGYRDANPGQNVGAIVPAWLIWSTPWTILGAHIVLDAASPMANVNVHNVLNRGGFANPIVDVQFKWNLGNGFFGGFQTGVYLPVKDELSILGIPRDFAMFQALGALSYLKDGWDLSATAIYGTGRSGDIYSEPGSYAPNWFNLDLTATKTFGKFEVGFVGFGSADLDAPVPGYAKQSQIALGGLVGYNFGVLNFQFKLTRDVMEQNYGGYDTRGWANITIPLWVAAPPAPVVAKY